MRITVERPLRLRWEVSDETLAAVASDRKLAKMDDESREQFVAALADYAGLSGTDREALAVKLAPVFARFGLTRPQENAVWDALAVRDPEEHIVGGTGKVDAGTELPRRRPAAGLAAVEPGDVLFGKLRPYLAKTSRVREQIFASTELLALRPVRGVDSRWLHYVIMSDQIVRWAVATSDGSKMPRTSWSALGEYRVTVPELST
jgi:hypothetical protein